MEAKRRSDAVLWAGWPILEEVIGDGEDGRRGTGGDARLLVAMRGVILDRSRREHEPLGNRLVGEPPRQQAQHLDLALAQSRRARTPLACDGTLTGDGEHRLDRLAVKAPGAGLRVEDPRRRRGRSRRP